jgi:hypothetical protein
MGDWVKGVDEEVLLIVAADMIQPSVATEHVAVKLLLQEMIGKASDTAVGPPGPGVKGGDTDAAEVIRLIYARREKSQYRVHPRSTVVVRAAAVREPLLEPSSQQYYVSPPYWDLMSHLCSILDPICQAAARRHHSSLDRGHWTST